MSLSFLCCLFQEHTLLNESIIAISLTSYCQCVTAILFMFSAAKFNAMIAQKQREVDSVKQQIQDTIRERDGKREESRKLEQAETTLQNMRFRLAQTEKELATLERKRVDPDMIKANFSSKLKVRIYRIALSLSLLKLVNITDIFIFHYRLLL